jgi:4-oxalocrotonate tautomerase
MPMITVQMSPGRTPDQKAELARRITDAFMETCGTPGQTPDGVWVVVEEVPWGHWSIGGKVITPPPA